MTATLEIADPDLAAALGYRDARDAVFDLRGVIVRCTPRRWTLMWHGQGVCLFRKMRSGRVGDARQEWRWLHELPSLGVAVARPALFARLRQRTVVATHAVLGSALDALLLRHPPDAALAYVRERVVPLLLRLHGRHLVLRDAYFNHLFASSLDESPTLIDVERVMRPWLRWRRWVVKDLAGLVSSWPHADGNGEFAAQLVHAYAGHDQPALLADVRSKALRIRAHQPKWG